MKFAHNRNSFLSFAFSCLFFLSLLSPIYAAGLGSGFYSARVKDISDRAYEPAIIELLDNAKESIILSMYILKPEEGGPISLLMNDLEEAIERGVSVEIYLNTREDRGAADRNILKKHLEALKKKGAKIYEFTPRYRLHDKVIIVDNQYVVEGSVNWSVSAIKSNYESAVLIDSPELAKAKLIRMRRFPLKDDDNDVRPDRPKGLEPLPEGAIVKVKKELMNNKRFFPAMVTRQANRAMDTYLLLLAESTRLGERDFFIPLEDMAVTLGIPPEWKDAALRRQVIKVLRDLENRYKLIGANLSFGKDAWVELKELPGDTFDVIGSFFAPATLTSKSQPAKFVALIKTFLEAEGKTIESFTKKELSVQFHTSEYTIRMGLAQKAGTPKK